MEWLGGCRETSGICFAFVVSRRAIVCFLLEAYMILLAENKGVFDTFEVLPPCAGRQRSGTDSPSRPVR
jgi:hypothetical protein